MKSNLPSIFNVDYPNLLAKVDIDIELGFSAKNSSNPATTFRTETEIKYPDHKLIFTDGSRIPEPPKAAAAVYIRDQEEALEIKLNDHASIFPAEASAILEALKMARPNNRSKFIIFSDSLSSIKAIAQLGPTSCFNPYLYGPNEK